MRLLRYLGRWVRYAWVHRGIRHASWAMAADSGWGTTTLRKG